MEASWRARWRDHRNFVRDSKSEGGSDDRCGRRARKLPILTAIHTPRDTHTRVRMHTSHTYRPTHTGARCDRARPLAICINYRGKCDRHTQREKESAYCAPRRRRHGGTANGPRIVNYRTSEKSVKSLLLLLLLRRRRPYRNVALQNGCQLL